MSVPELAVAVREGFLTRDEARRVLLKRIIDEFDIDLKEGPDDKRNDHS